MKENELSSEFLKKVEEQFLIRKIDEGGAEKISTGNINSTYIITAGQGKSRYILQMINKNVFTHPDQIMKNIIGVSTFLRKKVLQEGGDPSREVLQPIETLDLNGLACVVDDDGDYWRMYDFIENAETYDTIDSPEMFYKVGRAFGKFQQRLIDYPANLLYEAIPDFHNTPKRFSDFILATKVDKFGRLQTAKNKKDEELLSAIRQILDAEHEISALEIGKRRGELPIRVTHNDTKINNVMIDKTTKKPICVIDLDTIGPDTALVDYGDAIRSGANKAGEEAENPVEATMDMELFKAYTSGYLDETLTFTGGGDINDDPNKGLTKKEIELLHKAPRILTLELAMRFLGDYLNGDEYFKLKPGQDEKHNLKRALVQLHLAEDMKQKESEMEEFIKYYVKEKHRALPKEHFREIKLKETEGR